MNEKLEQHSADWQPTYMKTETNVEEMYQHQQHTFKNPTEDNVRLAMENMWESIAKMKQNMSPQQFEELQELMEAGASFETVGGKGGNANEEVAEEMKRMAEDLDMPDIGDVTDSNPGLKQAVDAFRQSKKINYEEEEEVIEHDDVQDVNDAKETKASNNTINNKNNNKVFDEDQEDEDDSAERKRRRERFQQE